MTEDRLKRLARNCYVDAHSEEHPLVREGRIHARLRELVRGCAAIAESQHLRRAEIGSAIRHAYGLEERK